MFIVYFLSFQECFPVRFKAVHFIGQPWYVEAALAVIRPFLKEKTRARIKLHGGNLSTLHECVPRDILPAELGGEGPSFNPLNWVHTLLESSQIAETPRPYCITQTAIYSKPPSNYVKPKVPVKHGVTGGDPARNTLLSLTDDMWQ